MKERSKIKSERDAYALIVGISTYQDNEISKLNWTINDAQAIYDLLINPDKAGFKKENVKLLLDNNATLLNIKDAISGWLYRKANEDSIVIIFFAGHGGVEEDKFTVEKDGLGKYLLPYDTKKDNLSASALSTDEFNKFLRAIRSKRLVVFMDSCYSGGVTEKKARDINIVDPYKKMAEGEGRLVIAASQPNQRSFEDDKLRHGVFTYHLIEALSGAAGSDDEGYVKAMDVYVHLSEKVPKTAMELAGGLQEPILRGDLKTDIILTANRQRLKELNEKKIKISKLNDLARQYYNEGNYSGAIAKWQEILKLSPENNNAIERIKESERILKKLGELNNSAQQFYDEGKYRIAITKWQEVLKLDSENRNAIEGIDKSEKNLIDFDSEKKIEIEVLNGLAQQLLVDNRYQKAITKWQEVLKLDAENSNAIVGIQKSKNYLKILEKDKIKINELNNQAQQLYEKRIYNEAIAKWHEVLELDPNNPRAQEIRKATTLLIEWEEAVVKPLVEFYSITLIFLCIFWYNSYRILGFGLLNWTMLGFLTLFLITVSLFYLKFGKMKYNEKKVKYELVWILFPILVLLQDIESLYLTFLMFIIPPFVVNIILLKTSRKIVNESATMLLFLYLMLYIFYLLLLGIKFIYDLVVSWI